MVETHSESVHAPSAPRVLFVGGPDVDARLDLMHRLSDSFVVSALGSAPELGARFSREGFDYSAYRLARKANPLLVSITVGQVLLILRRLRPRIVHTFDSKPGVWVRLGARMAGVPIVVGTLPGLGSLYASDRLMTRLIRFVYEKLQTLACRVSDITIFQNHDDARQFVAAGIVSQKKTAVILGSGVATDLYAPSQVSKSERDRLRRELGIQPNAIVVSMVGRVIRSKGVLEFMAAAQKVSDSDPNARFLLVGADDNESLDRLRAEELAQLRQTLIWPGPRQDIPAVLAISDIFVLPSAYREGIPRVLLEAASMALPIITTDSPGCREVVTHGVNGLLVPPRDSESLSQAIVNLIRSPDLRSRFGKNSRLRAVECFDLSVISDQVRSIYQELLASSE